MSVLSTTAPRLGVHTKSTTDYTSTSLTLLSSSVFTTSSFCLVVDICLWHPSQSLFVTFVFAVFLSVILPVILSVILSVIQSVILSVGHNRLFCFIILWICHLALSLVVLLFLVLLYILYIFVLILITCRHPSSLSNPLQLSPGQVNFFQPQSSWRHLIRCHILLTSFFKTQ